MNVHSDAKEVALSRIRQLSSSGLPLEPFARSLFELLNDAIPYSPNRSILLDTKDDSDGFLVSNNETLAALQPFREFLSTNQRSQVRSIGRMQRLYESFCRKRSSGDSRTLRYPTF
jgi:hypothetical protein